MKTIFWQRHKIPWEDLSPHLMIEIVKSVAQNGTLEGDYKADFETPRDLYLTHPNGAVTYHAITPSGMYIMEM